MLTATDDLARDAPHLPQNARGKLSIRTKRRLGVKHGRYSLM